MVSTSRRLTILSILSSIFAVSACTSSPPDVSASVPLVKPQAESSSKPSVAVVIEQGELLVNGEAMTNAANYTSALGQNCWKAMNYAQQRKTVCFDGAAWYLIENIEPSRQLAVKQGG